MSELHSRDARYGAGVLTNVVIRAIAKLLADRPVSSNFQRIFGEPQHVHPHGKELEPALENVCHQAMAMPDFAQSKGAENRDTY